ncbi:3-oxoacyl-ACP reductase FabG [Intrasporangium sp.]|uniref:SDR family NAD(P)-dependent oxidoreductase n=1 Tax=Intrasporangium sp. TaxID=1925024 RepID=UPI00293960CF|nr:3-oxoacyl-ACP reductase FabG [Intrasporangium sp.]MDV3222238.1 3-oxoacyl-ACP reductase FabG [Intrasporangium sp.]
MTGSDAPPTTSPGPERHDRVAVVTGAAQGIGEAVARRLSARGWSVAVLDRNDDGAADVASSLRAAGGSAIAAGADVADADDVARATARVVDELGPPTVLVNNAGFARDGYLSELSLDDWDSVLGVHLRGSFLMSRAVSPYMEQARWGRIVNISSISALGGERRANYIAAKSGLNGFTRALAQELGPQGITVNAVAPGFTDTAMTVDTARVLGRSLDEHRRRAAESLPVRRFGTVDDIAHAVDFFADERSGYVTGQVLYVSGGPHG